jgi:hypothetical protein
MSPAGSVDVKCNDDDDDDILMAYYIITGVPHPHGLLHYYTRMREWR